MNSRFPFVKREPDVMNGNIVDLLEIVSHVVFVHLHVTFKQYLILWHADLGWGRRVLRGRRGAGVWAV